MWLIYFFNYLATCELYTLSLHDALPICARPADVLDLLPMSDGGDGFGEIMSALVGAEAILSETVDAAHGPITATWWWHAATRSEEHTSELQSLAYLVCRLLLEKKNNLNQ